MIFFFQRATLQIVFEQNRGIFANYAVLINGSEESSAVALQKVGESIDLNIVRRIEFLINCSLDTLPPTDIKLLQDIFEELDRLSSVRFICGYDATVTSIPLEALPKFYCLVVISEGWNGIHNFFELSFKFRQVVFQNVDEKCFTPQKDRYFRMIKITTTDAKQYETYMSKINSLRFRKCTLQLKGKQKVGHSRPIIASFEKKVEKINENNEREYMLSAQLTSPFQYDLFKKLITKRGWLTSLIYSVNIEANYYELKIFKKIWNECGWLIEKSSLVHMKDTVDDKSNKGLRPNEITMDTSTLQASLYDGEFYDLLRENSAYTTIDIRFGSVYKRFPGETRKFMPLFLYSPVEDLAIRDVNDLLATTIDHKSIDINGFELSKNYGLENLQRADIYTEYPASLYRIFHLTHIEHVKIASVNNKGHQEMAELPEIWMESEKIDGNLIYYNYDKYNEQTDEKSSNGTSVTTGSHAYTDEEQ